MFTITKKRIIFPIICIAVALVGAFGVWFSFVDTGSSHKINMSIDMPLYSSIEELASSSYLDAVVICKVNGIVGREVDYGTANTNEYTGKGIPTVFYQVEVTKILAGNVENTIIIAMPDPENIILDVSLEGWETGDELLLFLNRQNVNNAPGIKTYNDFYATLSIDNGVFDILPGNVVRPRMQEAFTGKSGELVTFNLNEVEQILTKAQ